MLEFDVGLNQVFCEHVAVGEEVMVFFQRCEGCLQRGGCLRDGGGFLWWEFVEIFVHGRVGFDAVFDAVESGEHHGSEAQVGVA